MQDRLGTTSVKPPADWTSNIAVYGLLWGPPNAAIVGGLLLDVPVRTVVWIVALIWMGTACLLNARRCGRTHCRFTGPYYLAMIAPVLALGTGLVAADLVGWFVLAMLIVFGSKIIWWASETAWGKFS